MSSRFDNFVLVKEKFPYHGKGKDELLGALRTLLALPENKYIQKVVLEVDAPHIYIEKFLPAEEAGKVPSRSIKEVIRSKAMEEYEADLNLTPWAQIWDMFSVVHKEGLEVGFIAIGNKAIFQKWLGVRISTTNMTLLGIPIEIVDIPEDTFVICGTPERIADPDDIKFSLKGNIDEANNKKTLNGGPAR